MYIRHLPGKTDLLVDKSKISPNNVLFNPSADKRYIYIRANAHTMVDENNYILIYNELNKTMYNIMSPLDILEPTANLFRGVEDLRIAVYNDRVWFTATSTHASLHMTNELLVGHFDSELTKVERMTTVDIGSLPVKNVCPFVYQDTFCLIDTYQKKIYRVEEDKDPDSGDFVKFVAVKTKDLTSASGIPKKGFRGSTSPVHLHGSIWGFIVHDIIFNDNTKLVTRLAYFHHWVEMDMDRGVITYFSTPFWCSHWGIEYVSGLRFNKGEAEKEIELYVGVNDQSAVRYTTTLADLRIGK
jgi:hypothetical protein